MKNRDAPPPPKNKTLLFSDGVCIGSFWGDCKTGNKCDKSPYDKLLENPVLKKCYEKFLENRETNKDNVKLTMEEKVNELLESMKNRDAPPPQRNKTLLVSDGAGASMGSFWNTCKTKLKCVKSPYDKLLENPALKKEYEKFLYKKLKKLTLKEKVNELLESMKNRDATLST
jgi:hypothetical protein